MELQIHPEPSPEERAALVAVYERLLGEGRRLPTAYDSEWRRLGLRENVEDEVAPQAAPWATAPF
jgi:hypothetical protein